MGRVKEALASEVVSTWTDDQFCELHNIDVVTIKHLVDALSSLQKAYNSTPNGFVADRCESATNIIRIALRQSGT